MRDAEPRAAPDARHRKQPRLAIEPLRSPWLPHEQFAAVKAATSAPDALAGAKKAALAKIGQELKRARTFVDQHLVQLEGQLVAISNFLDGRSAAMFPPQIVMQVVEPPAPPPAAGAVAGLPAAAGAAAGTAKLESKTVAKAPPSVAFLVEDDLAADTPCTSTGLWRYMSAYSYFKTITPDDMDLALRLEDETIVFGADLLSAAMPSDDPHSETTKHALPEITSKDRDDFFKERVLGALVPVPSSPFLVADLDHPSQEVKAAVSTVDESQGDLKDSGRKGLTISSRFELGQSDKEDAALQASWDPSGMTRSLRDVGLVEMSDADVEKCINDSEDDEVGQEIRLLQAGLRASIRQTNAAKRLIRRLLDNAKPWLLVKEASDKDVLTRHSALLGHKKEAERRKKIKDKKKLRREALRVDIASATTQ